MVLDFIPHRSEAQMLDIPIDVAPLLVIGWLVIGHVGGLWQNRWTDRDETWRPCLYPPWSHCVKGDPLPQGKGAAASSNFGYIQFWPNYCKE